MIEPSDTERSEWPEATEAYVAELEAEVETAENVAHRTNQLLREERAKVERLEKWQDALRQRLHMAEEQIRECRQYLRLDDRNLVVGHIDAYFALPALNSGEGE